MCLWVNIKGRSSMTSHKFEYLHFTYCSYLATRGLSPVLMTVLWLVRFCLQVKKSSLEFSQKD
jgi:hypothetical protein